MDLLIQRQTGKCNNNTDNINRFIVTHLREQMVLDSYICLKTLSYEYYAFFYLKIKKYSCLLRFTQVKNIFVVSILVIIKCIQTVYFLLFCCMSAY